MTEPLRLSADFYDNVASVDYHKDPAQEPSLSSSIAKTLVTRTPLIAWREHPRLNPEFEPEVNEKFDMGDALHDGLSSGGARISLVDGFDNWMKADAKKLRDAERAKGFVPLLRHQAEQVGKSVAAVYKQLDARGIELGKQEPVLIAERNGVWMRAMIDAFNPPVIRDFKCTKINLADDDVVARHLAGMSYDLRAWFYLHVAELVLPDWAGRLRYEWVLVEEEPPHGIRIVECDATFREMGRRKGEHAIGLWERCMRTGIWPHLEGLPKTVPYPGWAENRWLERETREGFVQGPMATLRARENLVED